jgi:hypothetical protein
MDAILDAGFPIRFRFYHIPIKHRALIVFHWSLFIIIFI